MLLFMQYKFIFKSILLKVVIIKNNSFKCKSYKANFVENNNKNNIYYTIEFENIHEFKILSKCIYINFNKS